MNLMQYFAEKDVESIQINYPALAVALLDILKYNCDLETTKHTAEWLYRLSRIPAVLLSIYESDGIPVLVTLLSASKKNGSFYALKILKKLLVSQEGSKAAVRHADGVKKMVRILKNRNEKFLSVVTECLNILAYQNQVNKITILIRDGPAELVRILQTYSYPILLCKTARVLKVLSVCSYNQIAIILAGGLQALTRHLDNPSQKLVINCLRTLRNLSDAATELVNVSSLLKKLVHFLDNRDEKILSSTACILSNMTCNSAQNKELVCLESGVHALVRVILRSVKEEIIEAAICTLCNLTYHHPQAENAQCDVRLYNGLPAIVKFLNPPSSGPLIKAAIVLVKNLALCPNNRQLLLDLGAVDMLRNMLHSIYRDISRNRENLSRSETRPTVVGSVKKEDIIEVILRAFRNLTRNKNVRNLLKDANIMNTFVQILNKENEDIQCIVTCIFFNFTLDQDWNYALDQDCNLTIKSVGGVPLSSDTPQ